MKPAKELDFFMKELDELKRVSVAMQQDMPIAELEKLESTFKLLVRGLVDQYPGDASVSFKIARIQKEMGLLCKFKSYGVKVCTPLGYAIFLLNTNEGFSFQNHLDFKVELFHILEVSDGGYVYISTSEEWNHVFDEQKFQRWFTGQVVAEYDVFKKNVKPGDVIKIDRTGIVHTAIGCTLEEYANVSTDMVQRLYDQNKGKQIPEYFSREFVNRKLEKIVFPNVEKEIVFNQSDAFAAKRVSIDVSSQQTIETQDQYISMYVTQGKGELSIVGHSMDLFKGDPVLLIPGSLWVLKNTSTMPMQYSLLAIQKQNALK